MKPVKFKECNVLFGSSQPEYNPLPALIVREGQYPVYSCWNLSFFERIKILFTGKIWHGQYTFGDKYRPTLLSVDKNIIKQ